MKLALHKGTLKVLKRPVQHMWGEVIPADVIYRMATETESTCQGITGCTGGECGPTYMVECGMTLFPGGTCVGPPTTSGYTGPDTDPC
ncbi:MAG: hypothetical protein ABW106_09330 [Steroidobacteraceae bacterium]